MLTFQSVSPGLVETELPPKEYFETMPTLEPKDIANGVLYVLGTPPHVQVCIYKQVINSTNGQLY